MGTAFRLSEPAPIIIKRASEVVSLAGAQTPKDKAIALFLFVRDSIKFGFTRRFDEASPEETLTFGVGHCNPQGALFASLLQAQGIEARQRFVNLSPGVLRGVLSPPPPRLLHSYVELRYPLEPREGGTDESTDPDGSQGWIRVDGYIADVTLFDAARVKLLREGRSEGYGVHVDGSVAWDGTSDCFCQMADEKTQVSQDLGAFDSPGDLYSSPKNFQRLPWPVRIFFGLFAMGANSSLNSVRAEVVPAPGNSGGPVP